MIPRGDEVDQALRADIRVEALDQIGTLGRDAPVALAGLAGAAQVAAHGEQGAGCDVAGVRAERDGLQQICGVADGTADNDRNLIADALVAQTLVDSGERKLDRDADVVADTGRSRAGTAAVAVDADDVRARAGNTRSDRRYIMYGCDLDHDRLFVFGRFLEREYELAQVLDGVDIVVGSRGDGVRALRDHTGLGDVRADLEAGQMAADAGLCALAHLDLDGGAGFEVILVHAEAAGCDLNDGVGAVLIEVLVQAALAGIIIGTERAGCTGEGSVGVVGDRAVAHRGEHDRHVQLELRRHVRDEPAVLVALDFARLLAEEGLGLHRLAQRVDGRVGDLRSVDEDLVPVDRVRLRVAHRGEQHAARACLTVDLGDGLAGPVCVLLKGMVGLYDLERAGRAERYAAVAGDALGLVDLHLLKFRVVKMYFVGALTLAGAAADAAVVIADDLILRI